MTSLGVVTNRKKVDPAVRAALQVALSDAGFADARWYEAKRGSAATAETRSALDDGVDVVLAVGGDGTVRACAHALAGTEVPLAVAPTGTANLFANGFGLPFDPRAIAESIVAHHVTRIDLGVCNDMRFGVMAGTGYDAALMRAVDDGPKERFGSLSYVWAGVREARNQEPTEVRIDVDGSAFYRGPATCVLVGNLGELKAGMTPFPDASPTDGLLEVGVVSASTLREWAGIAARMALHRPAGSPSTRLTRGRSVEVTWAPGGSSKEKKRASKVPFELDGGAKGTARKLRYTCEPGALRLIVPMEGRA